MQAVHYLEPPATQGASVMAPRHQIATSIVLEFAVVALFLSACTSPSAQNTISQSTDRPFYYTIPTGARWELVGEWEYPGEDDSLLRYTTSIVRVDHTYVEIYSGTLIGGCCFWPQGIKLERKAAGTYWNPLMMTTYSIGDDASLTVTKRDGHAVVAQRTPANKSFVLGNK